MAQKNELQNPPTILVEIETPETEAEIEAEVEEVEAITEAAVVIAEIEANRDVELAQINAAVEIEHIEARKETEEKGELWQMMEKVVSQMETITEKMERLLELPLTPQLLVVEPLEPTQEILTPQSIPDQTTITQTEAEPESVAENLETEVQENLPTKRRIRAI